MTPQELKRLEKAEQLFNAGKLNEAFELLNDSSKFTKLEVQQKRHFQCLKVLILIYQNNGDEVVKLGEEIFKEGQKLNKHIQSFDGYFLIITGLGLADRFNEAFELIEEAERLFKLISNVSKNTLLQRKIRLSLLKAWINMNIGNTDLAEKCLEWILSLENEHRNTFEIVWANILMTRMTHKIKYNSDLAIEYIKKALFLAEKIKFKQYWIALCYFYYGRIDFLKNYDICLKHLMKSLKLFKKSKITFWTARVLSTIGVLFYYKGEYNQALEYLGESLSLYEIQSTGIEFCLDNLIEITLEKGDIKSAKKYFLRLENIYHEKKKGLHIKLLYQFDKALILKTSSRLRDKAKAERLLKQVIETKTIYTEVIEDACIYLCDLLLAEFRINKNPEVLDELNHYINKLLTIAEKAHDFQIFCDTFILQAKLALINFEVKSAQRFLNQAQHIAESYGIKRLAIKVSNEHDELLKQAKLWNAFKESGASLTERWELAGLGKQIDNMIRRQLDEIPEVLDEEPILLLIISEGGVPFFSQSFIEDKDFEDYLFGGFFSAINSFINERFSEGLDRASFGNHTLLMESVSPFLLCYVYKGQSYFAQKRLRSFKEELKTHKEMWDMFEESYQDSRKIELKDIPSLEPLITKIFINKTVPLDV